MNTGTLQIKTPEGIVFSQTLASPITRFLAFGIDLCCIMAMLTAIQLIIALLTILNPDFATALGMLLFFVVSIGYSIFTEWLWRGQSVGKRVMRLRVVDAEGMRLEFNQIVIRNLLRVVDLLPAFYAVGGIAALLNRKAQRLGDLAANTVVIRISKISQPDLEQLLPDKFNSLRAHPHLEARLRQRVTPVEARVQLFSELAAHFKAKVEFPSEAVADIADEQYVRNVVDVLYRTDARKKSQERVAA
jgi:uncharacterized RDD family membrane protein YckC